MKYTPEMTQKLLDLWQEHGDPKPCAESLGVTERSVIAKLSSLGQYQRKGYVDKLGQPPRKKEELVERIAELLQCRLDQLESLEKVNKSVLELLEQALEPKNLEE